MEDYNVIFENYKGHKFSDIMELHTFNNVSHNRVEHKSCRGCEAKFILDRVLGTNDRNVDDELIKDVADAENQSCLPKSDSMCNLLDLCDCQPISMEEYVKADLYKGKNCYDNPKYTCTSHSVSNVQTKSVGINSGRSKKKSDCDKDDVLDRSLQVYNRLSSHIRSSTESLLSTSTPNKLKGRRCVSKNTLVNKFLESIDIKTDNKLAIKCKTIKKPCSLYIKNVKVDRHLQDFALSQISNEISVFSERNKTDSRISSKLENFLHSQTLVYPNEKVYKVNKVLDLNGRPLLLVLTDYAIYFVDTGACCCTFQLRYTMCYEKLAAVVIGPFSQLLVFINKMNKKWYAVNTAAIYGSAGQFTMFTEIAIRRWTYVNSKQLFFSAVPIERYYQMACFYSLIPDHILPKEEDIIFLTWVWLQEEYIDVSPLGPQKESYIMFKGSGCLSWISSYIRLKGGVLYVFDTALDRVPKYTFELATSCCRVCRYCVQSDRPYSFEIVKGTSTYLFGAANEVEMTEWLQILLSVDKGMIGCYADEKEVSVSGCYLLMTESRLIVYTYPNIVCNHCHLDDVVSFKRTNTSRDLYCLLEFGCREALEEGGDWILHFVSKETSEMFCNRLEEVKPNLFLQEMESVIENESLINRCRRVNFRLQSMWDPFFTNTTSSRSNTS